MKVLRKMATGISALALCGTLSGCLFHRQQAPPLPAQAKTPNIYVPPPPPVTLPPMEGSPPPDVTDAKPVEAAEAKPKKKTRRQTPPPAPAAATAAPAGGEAPPTQVAKLGALGSGDESNPKQQQEVAGRISAVEKRINDLPGAVADREQKQIAKVRLFLKEASDALKGGDVEGAGILATKANLLLDDLTK